MKSRPILLSTVLISTLFGSNLLSSCKTNNLISEDSRLESEVNDYSLIYKKSENYFFKWPESLMAGDKITDDALSLGLTVGDLNDLAKTIEIEIAKSANLLGQKWKLDKHGENKHKFEMTGVVIQLNGASYFGANGCFQLGKDDSVKDSNCSGEEKTLSISMGAAFTTLSLKMNVLFSNNQSVRQQSVSIASAADVSFTAAKVVNKGGASAKLGLSEIIGTSFSLPPAVSATMGALLDSGELKVSANLKIHKPLHIPENEVYVKSYISNGLDTNIGVSEFALMIANKIWAPICIENREKDSNIQNCQLDKSAIAKIGATVNVLEKYRKPQRIVKCENGNTFDFYNKLYVRFPVEDNDAKEDPLKGAKGLSLYKKHTGILHKKIHDNLRVVDPDLDESTGECGPRKTGYRCVEIHFNARMGGRFDCSEKNEWVVAFYREDERHFAKNEIDTY